MPQTALPVYVPKFSGVLSISKEHRKTNVYNGDGRSGYRYSAYYKIGKKLAEQTEQVDGKQAQKWNSYVNFDIVFFGPTGGPHESLETLRQDNSKPGPDIHIKLGALDVKQHVQTKKTYLSVTVNGEEDWELHTRGAPSTASSGGNNAGANQAQPANEPAAQQQQAQPAAANGGTYGKSPFKK